MPRKADLSVNERAFILEALREGIRLDARPLDAYRSVELTFGEEFGQVNVRLGKTRYGNALPSDQEVVVVLTAL